MSDPTNDNLLEDGDQPVKSTQDVQEETLDAAQQSVADALKVCFFLLKVVMCVMLVLYAFSGVFSVPPQHDAVRLRFGKIVTASDGTQVIKPGSLHFALPFPLEQVVKVNTLEQSMVLRNDFWYSVNDQEMTMKIDDLAGRKTGPLNPEQDGSLITGDANIVHAQFSLKYQVTDTIKFITNVGDPSMSGRGNMAERIVGDAVRTAVIETIATLTADQIIAGNIEKERIVALAQKRLDTLNAGITILPKQFNLTSPSSVPLSTRDAFLMVVSADNDKAKKIEEAKRERSRVLAETAGEAHEQVWKMIQSYQTVKALGNKEESEKAEKTLMSAFADLMTSKEYGSIRITGDVSSMINESRNYRTTAVAGVQTEANRFNSFYNEFNGKPGMRDIIMGRLWIDAKQQVMNNKNVESFYLPKGQTYLELNPDPNITAMRDRERMLERSMAAQKAAAEAAAKAKATSTKPEGAPGQ
jgi:modulator of FtsH protease HflK